MTHLKNMTDNVDPAEKTPSVLLKSSTQELFEALMEQSADRIYIKDEKGQFIAASQALAEMHGYENRHEIKGLTDFDLFTEEHARQAHEDEQEMLRTGIPLINKVEKETWTDGSTTWVSSSKAPIQIGDNPRAGIIGISRDITAEFIAREKLKKNEQRLREQNEILSDDLKSARHVQEVMIPGRVPLIPGIQLAYLWKPMSSVGGDILSFPRNPDKALLFFMGDVSGHGITAAFYTVLLKYLTSHEAEHYNNNPQNYLDGVNAELSGRIENGFVTGLAGHFGERKEDGSRPLVLAHAGHPYVLIARAATGKIERLQMPSGIVMGIKGSKASKPSAVTLHPGDRFYAFTDGLIEASNSKGEEFGLDTFITQLESLAQTPLQETLETIHKRVCTFTGKPDQQDDMTCLAFEMS
jgi:sigma-B regulation protein RsbU (phosphoserine phosphatase)